MTASSTEVERAVPLRVAITNPYVWPHVRRGSERLLNDLAQHLVGAGHEVTVFAMAPEDAQETRDGVRYELLRERWRSNRRQLGSLHYFAWALQERLRARPLDVVFCLNYFDAYAAVACRRRHGLDFRVVFQNVGIPTRRYFRAVPLDRWFMHAVLRQADQCLVLSEFARETLAREFGVTARVLPPPVAVGDFADSGAAPSRAPMLLFVGDVDEPRKGARVLCRAFVQLKQHRPDLRLRFVGRASPGTRQALVDLPGVSSVRDSIEFEGVGRVELLPAQYRAAAVTVLPSVWEAFGLVLVESLAAGTPVVGARHGGVTDIIQGELVGELFDPGQFEQQSQAHADLATAIEAVLVRGKTPEVAAACAARAAHFGWAVQGPAYVELVESLVRRPVARGTR